MCPTQTPLQQETKGRQEIYPKQTTATPENTGLLLFAPKQISLCSQNEDKGNTSTFLHRASAWSARAGDDPPVPVPGFRAVLRNWATFINATPRPVPLDNEGHSDHKKGEKTHKIPNGFLPCPLAVVMSAGKRTGLQPHTELGGGSLLSEGPSLSWQHLGARWVPSPEATGHKEPPSCLARQPRLHHLLHHS